MGLFDSIEDFARYVEEKYLLPNNFKITEIIRNNGKHPTNYAKVKFEHDTFDNVFVDNLVLKNFTKIQKELKEVSIKKEYFTQWDDESKQETLLRMEEFYDTNHLYFNGKDEEPTPIDIKNKFYTFDGNKYYHEVAEFTGNRISLVYYNIEKPADIYQENFLEYVNSKGYIICILVKNDKSDLNQRLNNYKGQEDRIFIFCENKQLHNKYKNEINKKKYYNILFKDRKKYSLTEYIKMIMPEDKSIIFDN